MTETLTSAIIGHLVGDYLLQTDWMALNKKKRVWPCFVHCWIWAMVVMAFAGWHSLTLQKSQLIFGILLTTHFIQDHTNVVSWWMRLKWKDQSKFMESDRLFLGSHECDASIIPGLGPWSIIVVDNVWHIVTIWCVWRFLA